MKRQNLLIAVFAALLTVSVASAAAPLTIGKGDTTATVLAAQKGNRVTIRLASGEELSGKVVTVGDHVLQLGELAGKEFFDAAIPLESITAVIIRVRE
jgi:hypothetical protein